MGIDDFRGKRIGGCCKECTERYEACHDSCEKYQNARREWEEYKDMVKRGKKPTEYDEYMFVSIREMKKRRRNDRRS